MKKLIPLILFAAPIFAATPAAPPTPEPVHVGATVTLSASADGVSPVTFEWFRDGAKVSEGVTVRIPSATKAHAGTYTVKATNVFGSTMSDPKVLVVGDPPKKPEITITATKPGEVTVTVPAGTTVKVQK